MGEAANTVVALAHTQGPGGEPPKRRRSDA
jgi:hypothetical protein